MHVVKDEWDESSGEESESDAEEDITQAAGSVDLRSQEETLVGDEAGSETIEDEDDSVKLDFKRPRGVTDRDWMVYRVVSLACAEFDEKAREMWA